jgi:hypothetical protein
LDAIYHAEKEYYETLSQKSPTRQEHQGLRSKFLLKVKLFMEKYFISTKRFHLNDLSNHFIVPKDYFQYKLNYFSLPSSASNLDMFFRNRRKQEFLERLLFPGRLSFSEKPKTVSNGTEQNGIETDGKETTTTVKEKEELLNYNNRFDSIPNTPMVPSSSSLITPSPRPISASSSATSLARNSLRGFSNMKIKDLLAGIEGEEGPGTASSVGGENSHNNSALSLLPSHSAQSIQSTTTGNSETRNNRFSISRDPSSDFALLPIEEETGKENSSHHTSLKEKELVETEPEKPAKEEIGTEAAETKETEVEKAPQEAEKQQLQVVIESERQVLKRHRSLHRRAAHPYQCTIRVRGYGNPFKIDFRYLLHTKVIRLRFLSLSPLFPLCFLLFPVSLLTSIFSSLFRILPVSVSFFSSFVSPLFFHVYSRNGLVRFSSHILMHK